VAFTGPAPEADDPLLDFAPYAHRAPRRNSITPRRQRDFIAALAETGTVTQAARRIGASLEALYKLRNRPGAEDFAAAWEMALDRGIERLEDCALERAILGEERPVVRGDKVVATWRRYDTQLILFLLRQRRAERYHDSRFWSRRELSAVRAEARAVWESVEQPSEAEVYASIDAKLGAMMAAGGWMDEEEEEEEEREE
jgi:hypothetical protein